MASSALDRRPTAAIASPARSVRFDERRHLAAKIALRPVDALAQRITDKARHLDRRAHFTLGFLERLGNCLVRIVDVGLIEQAYLFVESLEPGFDDLADQIRGFALG